MSSMMYSTCYKQVESRDATAEAITAILKDGR